MYILEKGNMWNIWNNTDLFLITTNSFIKRSGDLVMGRGIALEAKNRYPSFPFLAGKNIKHGEIYGLKLFYKEKEDHTLTRSKIGLFQVKRYWYDKADLNIIDISIKKLIEWMNYNPVNRIDLNYPGIGNGKLDQEEVHEVIKFLSDKVHVWIQGEQI